MALKALYIFLLALAAGPKYADITGRVVGGHRRRYDQSAGHSDNVEHKVRLTGIDAPERGQPFGTVSTKNLNRKVAGKQVRVESTKSDRCGRILDKVWVQPSDCPTCGKTLNSNHAQILAGMAWWYR